VAPVLIELMKGLRSDAEAGLRRSSLLGQWCKDDRTQKTNLLSVVKRQLSEMEIAAQEIAGQERRLASEMRIANASRSLKEQELVAAKASERDAHEQLEGDESRIERTLGDADKALKFVGARSDQQGQGEAQDDDRSDESGTGEQREQTLVGLRNVRTQLSQERGEESSDMTSMMKKLANFSEHVGAAIMDEQAQIAAIRVEAAQRRREHARLRARKASLSALLEVATSSASAADLFCEDEAKHRGDVTKAIRQEAQAVQALVGQASAGVSSTAQSFLQVSASTATAAAVRRAVEGLRDLARRFPEDAQLYTDSLKTLSPAAHAPTAGAPKASASASDDEAAYNPLQGVRRFVDEQDTLDGSAAAPDLAKVQSLYQSLLRSVHSREGQLSARQEQCGVLAREAGADALALGRASSRVAARLKVAEAAVAEYMQAVQDDETHRQLVSAESEKLGSIAKEVEAQLEHAAKRLNEYAQRLIATGSSAEQAQDGYSAKVQGLLQHIEEHKAMLMRRSSMFRERLAEVGNADAALLRTLEEDAKFSARQIAQLKAESAVLSVQAVAKKSDHDMAKEFEGLVRDMCSDGQVERLGHKLDEAKLEEGFLRKAYPQAA